MNPPRPRWINGVTAWAAGAKGRVTAQWCDGSVPQIVRYDSEPPAAADKFPTPPGTLAENRPGLLGALTAASDIQQHEATPF